MPQPGEHGVARGNEILRQAAEARPTESLLPQRQRSGVNSHALGHDLRSLVQQGREGRGEQHPWVAAAVGVRCVAADQDAGDPLLSVVPVDVVRIAVGLDDGQHRARHYIRNGRAGGSGAIELHPAAVHQGQDDGPIHVLLLPVAFAVWVVIGALGEDSAHVHWMRLRMSVQRVRQVLIQGRLVRCGTRCVPHGVGERHAPDEGSPLHHAVPQHIAVSRLLPEVAGHQGDVGTVGKPI
mmetsp:Transcript_35048/g.90038  ORF Transcript_35048/g.90038 Transcript_35048/m.90038 type:complete len:238 (-) Transcript_35048:607-1320(-)